MTAWDLVISKKMGDYGGLERVQIFTQPDLQIDSFPGATFRHAEAMLAKTAVSSTVEKLVLSFGLNNRAQKPDQTSIPQLQQAVRMAQIAFPRP